jgi:hypothetical protein
METVGFVLTAFIVIVLFGALLDWVQANRKRAVAILLVGVLVLVLAANYPDIASRVFGVTVAGGSVALGLALALFIWVAPAVVIGFLIWAFIQVFSSSVASEIVRRQSANKSSANRDRTEAEQQALQKASQASPPVPPPLPTFNSAERARVLALGKIRDGANRHPILDTPWVSVANPPAAKRE